MIDPKEQELTSDAICERRFQWCRSRLLHALAGAAEQGVLQEVLAELLPDEESVQVRVLEALAKNGWVVPGALGLPPAESERTVQSIRDFIAESLDVPAARVQCTLGEGRFDISFDPPLLETEEGRVERLAEILEQMTAAMREG